MLSNACSHVTLLSVNFLTWLFEEMDTPSKTARFAKIVYDDINNGCGSRRFTPTDWKNHFLEEHSETALELIKMLEFAYMRYALSSRDKKGTL